jgi:hypothetical protein
VSERLSAAELREFGADHLAELVEAEELHGGQAAAIEAKPELAPFAPMLQWLRAEQAAGVLGLELRGDGRPFPPEVIAEASRVLRAVLLSPDDPDPLV